MFLIQKFLDKQPWHCPTCGLTGEGYKSFDHHLKHCSVGPLLVDGLFKNPTPRGGNSRSNQEKK